MFPAPSCFVCDGHFTSSGPLSRCVLQCCPRSIHLQCVTDLVHLPSQSVVCPACNSQSPSSLGFLHFQHLCCVRQVEAPAGECMVCSSPQTYASSFSLPCCRQRIHYECLARSVHACGDHCPFCTQDLVPVLSDPLLTASFKHLNISIDFNAPPANSSLNSLYVPDGMPHPPPIFPFCCAHSCGPPDFEPLDDRRMEWSPIHRLPKAPRLLGFLNGSVLHAVRPLPFRTSLLFPQSRVLSALRLRLSSLTGPQDALCVSAFPVNSLSLTTVSAPHLSLLFHPRLLFHRRQLFHPTMILLLTGFRTVLFPVFIPPRLGTW